MYGHLVKFVLVLPWQVFPSSPGPLHQNPQRLKANQSSNASEVLLGGALELSQFVHNMNMLVSSKIQHFRCPLYPHVQNWQVDGVV